MMKMMTIRAYIQYVINLMILVTFTITKQKFWEELICLLSLHKSLFEVHEPNLMELNLSQFALTSFNSI
jgi:hypothetical protein